MQNPRYAGLYLRSDTFDGAAAYLNRAVKLNSREMERRAKAFEQLRDAKPLFSISEKEGFAKADLSSHPRVKNAVRRCEEVIDSWRESGELDKQENVGKSFRRSISIDKGEPRNYPVFELALSRELVRPIAEYLGVLPVLLQAEIWYSPNVEFHGRSQFYHIDHADYRQLKVFICIDDVDLNTGPLNVVPADISRRVFDKLRTEETVRYRNTKITDEQMRETAGGDFGVFLTGKKYQAGIVDTCRCYHFGSRPPESGEGKPRKVLYLQYTTPFPVSLPVIGRKCERISFPFIQSREQQELADLLMGYAHQMHDS